jgi:hypothetical protein
MTGHPSRKHGAPSVDASTSQGIIHSSHELKKALGFVPMAQNIG